MKNTRLRDLTGKRDPVVVMTLTIVPRGSGNRQNVERLARAFKGHKILGPHITRVIKGSTRLDLHIRPGMASAAAWLEAVAAAREELAAQNDPNQMELPLGIPA